VDYRYGGHRQSRASNGALMTVRDEELIKAIEASAFHIGYEAAKAQQMQENYRKAIRSRLMPRMIELVMAVSGAVVTGKYRQAIIKTRKLVALMERISED
jgi:hypothetical protein